MAGKRKGTGTRRREKRIVGRGKAYIHATFNNTIITLTDLEDKVVTWASAGTAGFKGTRKGTPYAAQMAAEQVARKGAEFGLRQVEVYIKGAGPGRETAIRSLQAAGVTISGIRDLTPIPHNGCRPPKRRKV